MNIDVKDTSSIHRIAPNVNVEQQSSVRINEHLPDREDH